ncbi:MAG: DegT/DnrJ/EryC1/StrS family aminotransferase [Rhodoblastus sp.]|nr:DegT/DnrJ/EryC1/StrS family aminotransferase [Rhodoblastus sp.]
MTGLAIPVFSLSAAYEAYRTELSQACDSVLSGGWYINGANVAAFETEFAAAFGLSNAIGVASGTDALIVALRAFDLGPDDLVFTVSHTAVATVAAIELAGASPVLVDIDPRACCIDPDKLESAILAAKAEGARPRAVVAVHIYGHPAPIDALLDICRRHDLLLIEDCAQAHGSRWRDASVGTYGDAACFSFYPTKNLGAFGDAGAVSFRDPAKAEMARAIREYGWRRRYVSDICGMNSRLDELQAALLRVRLRHLNGELSRRRAIASIYDEILSCKVATPKTAEGATHSYHLYVIDVDDRDGLATRLAEAGIGTGVHYPVPIHLQPAYLGRVRVGPGGLPVTERMAGRVLSLPMFPFLSDQECETVARAVIAGLQAGPRA